MLSSLSGIPVSDEIFTPLCFNPLVRPRLCLPQDLIGDANPMVVANAVAALSEIQARLTHCSWLQCCSLELRLAASYPAVMPAAGYFASSTDSLQSITINT